MSELLVGLLIWFLGILTGAQIAKEIKPQAIVWQEGYAGSAVTIYENWDESSFYAWIPNTAGTKIKHFKWYNI